MNNALVAQSLEQSESSRQVEGCIQGPEPDMWVSADGTMHEKCRLYFMVGSDLISEGEVDPGSLPELGYRRTGIAYVCPDCARVWATAILVDSRGAQCAFEVTAAPCENHHSQWHVPGSLLSGYRNDAYLPLLSARALKREFVVHHRWITRNGGQSE